MILCAGLGTRLGSLSSWCAKPLIPVGDRPALAHIVERVRRLGGPIVANAHHRPNDLRAFARATRIALSEEADLLGTAGGIAHARALLGEGDVLVWNGDILCELDPCALASAHESDRGEATLAILPRAKGEGNVGLDAAGNVVRLRQETTAPGEARGGDFIGIYVLGADLRRTIPARGGMIEDVCLPALHRGARIRTFEAPRVFFDIGTPAQYLAANLAWLAARNASTWSAPTASIDSSARVTSSIVGAGARVTGSGDVTRCVVWPGAEARAPLADAIVAPLGVVRIGA